MNVPTSVLSIKFSYRWYHPCLFAIVCIICSTLFYLNCTMDMKPQPGLIRIINGKYLKYHHFFTRLSKYFCAIHFTCYYLVNKYLSFFSLVNIYYIALWQYFYCLLFSVHECFSMEDILYSLNHHIYFWSWLVWWIILNWFVFC